MLSALVKPYTSDLLFKIVEISLSNRSKIWLGFKWTKLFKYLFVANIDFKAWHERVATIQFSKGSSKIKVVKNPDKG